MELELKWDQPLKLIDGSNENLIFTVDGLEEWEGCSGIYMFCRKYGKSIIPLYIGKAINLLQRINQQLNNTKLMKGIEKAPNGEKVLVIGEYCSKSGQDVKKAIAIIERALIEHALAQSHDLINKQGTKTPVHQINYSGYLAAKSFSGLKMKTKILR